MRPHIRNNNKAIVLLSGGLDSATTLYFAKSKGYSITSLIFDYGQRHKREIDSAIGLAKAIGSNYRVIKLNLPTSGSSLLDRKIKLPRRRVNKRGGIPSTYVPARNLIFLSLAVSLAEGLGARTIFIGANSVDYSGYPDCRPQFYLKLKQAIKVGTKSGVEGKPINILTPLIKKSKKEIIKLGRKLGVPFEFTWSCYKGAKVPCGVCESCFLRKRGFQEAGLTDPLLANYGK